MKRILPIVISIAVFLIGMGVMFYPTISNWVYDQTASYAVSNYMDQVNSKSNEEYLAEFATARAYNATLTGDVRSFSASEEELENPDYWETMDEVDGIMGIIEIPAIDVTLPIYHGTDETVLQKGTGHLEGSALPTGDVGNHTIITGHTGLPTATLFTDLDELVIGDYFYLDILDQIFAYEIVNISTVLPSETEQLSAQADKDLVTLVTCTPYGVNSHRLLVQGSRVDIEVTDTLTASAVNEVQEEPLGSNPLENLSTLITVAVWFVLLFLGTALILVIRHRRNSR